MLPTRKYMNEKPVEVSKLRKGVLLPLHPFIKLDGIHVIVHVGEDSVPSPVSRTNEPLPSLQEQCARHVEAGHFLPGHVYFCEAWSPYRSFPEISGAVRRQKEQVPVDLDLYPFDCVTIGEWIAEESLRTWIDRVNHLRLRYPVSLMKGLTMIPVGGEVQGFAAWREALAQKVTVHQDQNGPVDGIICRDVNAGWSPGPATGGNVVKFKPRPTYDLRVTGCTPGKGKYVGMIGALIVRTGNDTYCEVGTGLTDDMRRQAPADYVGLIAEVSTLGVNKSGKLREPAFLRWRLDKTVGDLPADEET